MNRTVLFLFAATLAIVACKKNNHSNFTDGLLADYDSAMLNQSISFVDTTWLFDSLRLSNPPRSRQYRWIISPSDSQAVFSWKYLYGFGTVVFNHAGTFHLSANIYDSLGATLIGHTTAVTIKISGDSVP
jgi:hypothetical protein